MKIKFQLPYKTKWGQYIYVGGSRELGGWDESKAIKMSMVDDRWEAEVEIKNPLEIEYKYFIKNEGSDSVDWEFGEPRKLTSEKVQSRMATVCDFWRSSSDFQNLYYTSPFKRAFFNRDLQASYKSRKTTKKKNIRLQLRAARIGQDYQVGIVGSTPELGEWDDSKVVLMNDKQYPTWKIDLSIDSKKAPFEYKYVIYSHKEKKIVTWETGPNRRFSESLSIKYNFLIQTDEYFEYPVGNWKCAGIAIPVFSLRTEESGGCGEFADIIPMVDWVAKTGMRIVQVLPVNDTIAIRTWVDSYPYAAISVNALHPMFANMSKIGKLRDSKKQSAIDKQAKALNELSEVDYEAVLELKSEYFKLSYLENKNAFLSSSEFREFIMRNQSWVHSYAAFSYLRDKFGTPDFTKWEKYQSITDDGLNKLVDPQAKHYDDIAVHYYIQYYLDKQLKEASAYARSKGVVLKGDIPIGIYRNSVDAWRSPHLFNMACQAGAPPDDFAISGQNWGFPTYNWEEMAKDGYAWWTDRLVKMAEYFDIFRIDHILGFFRIWEIPWEHVEGIMGRFNPSLPLTADELEERGIHFDRERFCKPYIRRHTIQDIFGKHAESIIKEYLVEYSPDCFQFRSSFDTQRKVKGIFDEKIEQDPNNEDFHIWLRNSLFRLHSDVLFMEASHSNGEALNPRIALHNTFSYKDLDHDTQQKLNELYTDFFYKRHNEFWRDSAMTKLPMVKAATNMLIGGEDLGMVPDCVPGVMQELQMLSLAIQRMPNDDRDFWHPSDTPYMSVTSTGSHDMPTLREWWQEDGAVTQNFYKKILGRYDAAPFYCEPWIAYDILNQHMNSPSMLAIFPLQDVLAIDGRIRRQMPEEEKINIPAIPQHYWKYRMHYTLDQLLKEDEFSQRVRDLVEHGGRLADY